MSNAGLFATVAREYANFRPGYPPELFAWLARSCTGRDAAWDCGCGSGQASTALAEHFDVVHATDISPEQITAAAAHPRVKYSVAPAESSGLAAASVDLVTVAQSLHWFEVEAFYREARRVAKPGALLAVWTYPRPEFVDPALDRVFLDFYTHVVGPCWPPQRRHVESHYRTLPFPFDELPHPSFGLELQWVFEQVMGYVSSWSATARYRAQKGTDPVPLLRDALRPVWPGEDGTAALRMPLVLRAGKLASWTAPSP
jgi:ubiquinone/menaquinone biosynthesis C-methylase UbiE